MEPQLRLVARSRSTGWPAAAARSNGQGRLYDLFREVGGAGAGPMITWRSIDGSSAVAYEEPVAAPVTASLGSLFTGP